MTVNPYWLFLIVPAAAAVGLLVAGLCAAASAGDERMSHVESYAQGYDDGRYDGVER